MQMISRYLEARNMTHRPIHILKTKIMSQMSFLRSSFSGNILPVFELVGTFEPLVVRTSVLQSSGIHFQGVSFAIVVCLLIAVEFAFKDKPDFFNRKKVKLTVKQNRCISFSIFTFFD